MSLGQHSKVLPSPAGEGRWGPGETPDALIQCVSLEGLV